MLHKDFANPSILSRPHWSTRPRASSLPELHGIRARKILPACHPAYHSLRGDIIPSEEIPPSPPSSKNSSADYIPLASIEIHEAIVAIERTGIYLNSNDQSNDPLINNEEYIPLCSYKPIRTWKRVNEVHEARLSAPDRSSRGPPAHLYGACKILSRREQIMKLFPTIPPPPHVPLPSLPSPISLGGAEETVWRCRTASPLPQVQSAPPPSLARKASVGTFGEPKTSPVRALKQTSVFLRPRTMSGRLLKIFKYGRDQNKT